MVTNERLVEGYKGIRLLLMDCDGVLTDGRLYFTADGEQMKVFDVKDGQGLALWHQAGFSSGIISGRGPAAIIQGRASELGIAHVACHSNNKVVDLNDIVSKSGVSLSEIAYVADDVGDLPVMDLVGYPVAVADAVESVRSAAKYVTRSHGGRGAIREVVDLLLSSRSGD